MDPTNRDISGLHCIDNKVEYNISSQTSKEFKENDDMYLQKK